MNAARGEIRAHAQRERAACAGGLTRDYRRGTRVTARLAGAAATNTFGQPTIAGIGGWGFEADLRLDPSNANRLYMSSPDSANADSSFIWRSLDGGKTFKWVPGAAPLGGKVTTCHGGGDTELAVDPAGRLYFNDLTLANFSVARSDDFGRTFTCSNTGVPDTVVDRQWYALDGDPTAGGSLYLTNDEVFNGNVAVREHAAEQHARHVSLTGRGRGRDGGARVRPAESHHAAGLVRRGDHGQQRGQPGRDEDGPERRDAAARP